MACSSSCPAPGTHASMGECLRSKGIKVAYTNSAGGWDATRQKKWDAELDAYRAATAEGIQPATTRMHDIQEAKRISDKTGQPFRADA